MTKRLFLIMGLPGSGKTTLARLMAQEMDGVAFATDDLFVVNGEYKFDPTKLSEYHKKTQERVEEWICQDGILGVEPSVIIVHNTFSRKWERQPYLDLAAQYGYEVTQIYVHTDLTDDELAARNVHGVPSSVIANMRKRWEL